MHLSQTKSTDIISSSQCSSANGGRALAVSPSPEGIDYDISQRSVETLCTPVDSTFKLHWDINAMVFNRICMYVCMYVCMYAYCAVH